MTKVEQLEAKVARLERLLSLTIQAVTMPGYDGAQAGIDASPNLRDVERVELGELWEAMDPD